MIFSYTVLTYGTYYYILHTTYILYCSPTLMMNCQVHPVTDAWIVPTDIVTGFVTWPVRGKFTSFDGRYLHASPTDLTRMGVMGGDRDGDGDGGAVRRRGHHNSHGPFPTVLYDA